LVIDAAPNFNWKLKEFLSRRQINRVVDSKRKPSAVLVPICYSDGQYHILFTKRTSLVRYHKGEISFPGGGYHGEDGNLQTTAIRETWEEIGLAPEDVQILGELDDRITKSSQYTITPFVGFFPCGYTFKLNPFETAEIIQIPILELLKEGCRSDGSVYEGQMTYQYAHQTHRITGATAWILKQLLEVYCQVNNQQ
jgi:8-oxo-dGTP pyrophosphatase MutT (NUDIX family)